MPSSRNAPVLPRLLLLLQVKGDQGEPGRAPQGVMDHWKQQLKSSNPLGRPGSCPWNCIPPYSTRQGQWGAQALPATGRKTLQPSFPGVFSIENPGTLDTTHRNSAPLRYIQEKMTFPSCRDPKKIHLYLPGLSASLETNSLQHSRGPAGSGRPVIPWLVTVLTPPTCLPKKGWNSRLHKEFTPFQCLSA